MTACTERYLQPRLDVLGQIAQQAIDAGRLPPDTDPSVIQDILASSIGSVLLQHAKDVTAGQVERRLRILLHRLPALIP